MAKNPARENTNNNYQEIGQIHQLGNQRRILFFKIPKKKFFPKKRAKTCAPFLVLVQCK